IDRRGLEFGYPFAAGAEALALDLPAAKVALVAALFANDGDARGWQAQHPGFQIVRIRPSDSGANTRVAIQLDSPGDVPAWDRVQADRLAAGKRKPGLARRDAGAPRGDPICRVKGNDLFVLSDKQWERIVYQGRENGVDFLPVPCGD